MTSSIESVAEADSLATAPEKMRDIDIGALPVRDTDNNMTGMITDRDIVVRAVAAGKDPKNTKVAEAMTSGVVSCPAEQSVEEAVALMEKQQIRRLVILDKDNNAVGVLALGDVAVKAPGKEISGEAVEEISKPAQPAK